MIRHFIQKTGITLEDIKKGSVNMPVPVTRDKIRSTVEMMTRSISPNTKRCIFVVYFTQNGEPDERHVSASIIHKEELPKYAGKTLRKFLTVSGARFAELTLDDFHVGNTIGDVYHKRLAGRFAINILGLEGVVMIVPIKVDTPDERMILKFGQDSAFLAYYASKKISSLYNGVLFDEPILDMKHRVTKRPDRMAEKLYPFTIYNNCYYEIARNGEVPVYLRGEKLLAHLARNTNLRQLPYGGFGDVDLSEPLHNRTATMLCHYETEGYTYECVTIIMGILPQNRSGLPTGETLIPNEPLRIRRISQETMNAMKMDNPEIHNHIY